VSRYSNIVEALKEVSLHKALSPTCGLVLCFFNEHQTSEATDWAMDRLLRLSDASRPTRCNDILPLSVAPLFDVQF